MIYVINCLSLLLLSQWELVHVVTSVGDELLINCNKLKAGCGIIENSSGTFHEHFYYVKIRQICPWNVLELFFTVSTTCSSNNLSLCLFCTNIHVMCRMSRVVMDCIVLFIYYRVQRWTNQACTMPWWLYSWSFLPGVSWPTPWLW